MIYIRKGATPQSLIEHRRQPNATYDNFREKEDVQHSLLAEQGFLCAYCMRRIRPDTVSIEHIYPQRAEDGNGRLLELEYSNMLGVCDGFEGRRRKYQTCDSRKDQALLKKVNPLNAHSVDAIAYRNDGTIYSEDKDIDDDLNNILNLNCESGYLKENRKAVIVALNDYLLRKSQGTWSKSLLERTRNYFETEDNGYKREYLGVILYSLKKHMKKARQSHKS